MLGSVLYEALIDATGSGALGDVILAAADDAVGVDEVFGYCFEDGLAPVRIASSGRVGSSISRATLYSHRYHLLDPLAWLTAASKDGGPTRFGRILTAEVTDSTYRRECYDRPGFWEKLSFARRRGHRHYILSFYRNYGRRPARDSALTELTDLIFPILRKQVELLGDDLDRPIVARIEDRLAKAYPKLTAREKQVCARTLIGMTAEAIALDLGVGSTSVLTYRRRAYERYRISSAHEMIGNIM